MSSYYFKKSVKKSLTPYLQFLSYPFRGIDSEVKKELNVTFRDNPVENLLELQFVIANTGDKAIRDIIEPLRLDVPEGCELLDATLLHVSPEERKVGIQISQDRRQIFYDFPLLNSDEFFITKILLNGSAQDADFRFHITVDELPPVLIAESLPSDAIGTSEKREFEPIPFFIGAFFTIFGLALAVIVYEELKLLPSIHDFTFLQYFKALGIRGFGAILSVLTSFFVLFIGVMATVAAFTSGSFPPPRKRFIVPDKKQLLRTSFDFFEHRRMPNKRVHGSTPPVTLETLCRMEKNKQEK